VDYVWILGGPFSVEVSESAECCSDVGFGDLELAFDGSDGEVTPFVGVNSIVAESIGCVTLAVSDVDDAIKGYFALPIRVPAVIKDFVESFESVVSGHGSWLVWGCLSR
jgi:hypothetical protein